MTKSTAVAVPEQTSEANIVPLKPMNQTQLKNLQKLVEGDFMDLMMKVRNDIERRKTERIREINEKYNDEKAVIAAQAKLRSAIEKARSQLQAVVDGLREKGFTTTGQAVFTLQDQSHYLQAVGRSEAVARVNSAAQRLHDVARNAISAERRKIERQILLQGITGQAAFEIINDMPDMKDVFALVQQEMAEEPAVVAELLGE